MPAEFWQTDRIRDALAARDMGALIAAYRTHPYHGRPIRQDAAAVWLGISQSQLSRIERGLTRVDDIGRLLAWAAILAVPDDLLWIRPVTPSTVTTEVLRQDQQGQGSANRAGVGETWDMNRRNLLRLATAAATTLAAGSPAADWQRLAAGDPRAFRHDSAAVHEYGTAADTLWRQFTAADTKRHLADVVHGQLAVLLEHLRATPGDGARRALCQTLASLFQLAGEISLDTGAYLDAAHCYTLAATAAREADAADLWACALTRHAYVCMFGGHDTDAIPMLQHAAAISRHGDSALSTRYWISAVLAQAHAATGQLGATLAALDAAEAVHDQPGPVHNGGWLRFDGSRLEEDRASALLRLGEADRAEPILTGMLAGPLPARRYGCALTSLATVGALRGDPTQIVHYGSAAVETARTTHSAVIRNRLHDLQHHLAPFHTDRHVRRLDEHITALTGGTL
ncbi:helix-turn-helix domain-containing protein [Dactylosporangium sp. CA-139114]|uniref:helix-turn-helix domain-containing protein n=1 Tax=Dactylosporangium sp. CA-139114 TaxID=3239931 RepID=UPI003D9526BC